MAIIKCSECGKDISDKATVCIGCGAPLSDVTDQTTSSANSHTGDLNGDGKIDFNDFKLALSRTKKYASEKVDDAVKFGKEKLRSAKEKDAAAVEKLAKEFGNTQPHEQTESQIKLEKFKAALESTIDVKFADIMRSKNEPDIFLTYVDAQILTATVRNIFKNLLKITPNQVEAALTLSEAVLAPSTKEKANLVKKAAGVGGGTAGIGIVIASIASALGWGASAGASLAAFFTGASLGGPIFWATAGLALAAIAGYFASTSNNQTDSERFIRVLKTSTAKGVDAIWDVHASALSDILSADVKA